MRRLIRIVTASVLVASTWWTAPSHAQTILGDGAVDVHDNDQDDTLNRGVKAVNENTSKHSDTSSIFSGLSDDATDQNSKTANAMPETSDVNKWLSPKIKSNSSSEQATAETYKGNFVQANSTTAVQHATSGQTKQLLDQLNSAAAIQGMAAANLDALKSRLDAAKDMAASYQNAKNVTDVAAYNGRVGIENMIVSSQQAQSSNIVAMAIAQAEINRINHQQAIINDYSTMASILPQPSN